MTSKIKKYISYYQLKTWIECKKLHYLQSIEKSIPREESQYQSYGLALEDMLEKIILEKELGHQDTPEENFQFFLEYYTNNLANAKEVDKELELSHHNSGRYFAEHFPKFLSDNYPNFKYEHSQYKIFEELDYDHEEFDFLFNGFVDLIFSDGDTIYFIDYKSSNRGWNKYNKSDENTLLQLVLYKLFLENKPEFVGKQIKTQFWVFRTESPEIEIVDVEVTEEQKTWATRKINSMIYKAYVKKQYPKNIVCGRFCKCV